MELQIQAFKGLNALSQVRLSKIAKSTITRGKSNQTHMQLVHKLAREAKLDLVLGKLTQKELEGEFSFCQDALSTLAGCCMVLNYLDKGTE